MSNVNLQGLNDIEGLQRVAELHVIKNRCDWYKTHRHFPWFWFRAVGIATIVSSISIPFLVSADGVLKSLWAPIAALLVAVLTSLNTFFAWQKSWEKRVRVWLTIDSYVAIWKTEIVKAKRQETVEKGFEMALEATQDLINKTNSLEVEEAAALSARFELKVPGSGVKESRSD